MKKKGGGQPGARDVMVGDTFFAKGSLIREQRPGWHRLAIWEGALLYGVGRVLRA